MVKERLCSARSTGMGSMTSPWAATGQTPPAAQRPGRSGLPDESGEIVLTLRAATPVIPEQIPIFSAGPVAGIRRVEVLQTQSGLGRQIYQVHTSLQPEALVAEAYAERLVLPVEVDFEVDTVFIAFEDPVGDSRVGAVAMTGSLTMYVQAPPAGAETLYYLGDALGSARQMVDGSGAVVLTRAYQPYGVEMHRVGSAVSAYGFTGEWQSDGLVHLRARFYAILSRQIH
jgi:hypothetical protein